MKVRCKNTGTTTMNMGQTGATVIKQTFKWAVAFSVGWPFENKTSKAFLNTLCNHLIQPASFHQQILMNTAIAFRSNRRELEFSHSTHLLHARSHTLTFTSSSSTKWLSLVLKLFHFVNSSPSGNLWYGCGKPNLHLFSALSPRDLLKALFLDSAIFIYANSDVSPLPILIHDRKL